MDYKELIEQLKRTSPLHGTWLRERMLEAAAAIETLLEERDAAMKYIPKVCSTCEHWDAGGCNAPITGGECAFDLRQAWQWRGPQKEDGEV